MRSVSDFYALLPVSFVRRKVKYIYISYINGEPLPTSKKKKSDDDDETLFRKRGPRTSLAV